MNCFLGRDARPGARSSRRSRCACMPTFGGPMNPAALPGKAKLPPGRKPGYPGCGCAPAGNISASRNASSLRLSAIIAMISAEAGTALAGFVAEGDSGAPPAALGLKACACSSPGKSIGCMLRVGTTGTNALDSRWWLIFPFAVAGVVSTSVGGSDDDCVDNPRRHQSENHITRGCWWSGTRAVN